MGKSTKSKRINLLERGHKFLFELSELISPGIINSLPLTLVNGILDKTIGFSLNRRLNSSAKAKEGLLFHR